MTTFVNSIIDSDILFHLELSVLDIHLGSTYLLPNYFERRVGKGLVGEDGIGATGES